jgi:choline dehydrogenase
VSGTSVSGQRDALSAEALSGSLPLEVDVVVVGGGAAGCVLAARLSEDPACRVLLLESGTTTGREEASRIPGMALTLMAGETAWPDLTAAQSALDGRQVYLAQGRGLGGGSSMNAMAWFHGHPTDFDAWAKLGAGGWAWADVAPTFGALENHELGPDEWHGVGGPMTVTQPRDVSSMPLSFLAAGEELGLGLTRDFNGERREGVGLFSNNVRDGVRHSVVDGYLVPAAGRGNLLIRTGCHVTKIVTGGTRAQSVAVSRGTGQASTEVLATRAVVLAAGALRSPQVLMLSGIGPAAHLAEHGIPVARDLPGVGENLQDHVMITPVWPVTDGSPLRNALTAADERAYRLARRGPLASQSQVGAVLRTEADLTAPDIQITLALLGFTPDMQVIDKPVVTAALSLLAPGSAGTVRLASADPLQPPVADPRYLTDPGDRARLRAGLCLVKRIFDSSALSAVTGAPIEPSSWTDDALDSWIRSNAGTEWHPAGTCAMGTGEQAVVDPATMAVHGFDNLYVADSSVMPAVTRGNLQAPVIMLAERAARRIRSRLGA